jgi:hypothetical protein
MEAVVAEEAEEEDEVVVVGGVEACGFDPVYPSDETGAAPRLLGQ